MGHIGEVIRLYGDDGSLIATKTVAVPARSRFGGYPRDVFGVSAVAPWSLSPLAA